MSDADMQAVVVIHGMGEQIPMDTIKTFVEGVWTTDKDISENGLPNPTEVWSKPDVRTDSLELRRITTRESIKSPPEFPTGVRTDFYELYWADLTAGGTWDALKSWILGLLLRPWRSVPPDLRLAWLLLWLVSLITIALGLLVLVPGEMWKGTRFEFLASGHWLLVAVTAGAAAFVHRMGTSTFGRVVRYTRATPDNIAARAAVRERGLKLLRALHDSPQPYRRIIIVAHSLGSILAHDLLSYFWAEREAARTIQENTDAFAALCLIEEVAADAGGHSPTPGALGAYREAQAGLRRLLAGRPRPTGPNEPDARWLISDLVTFGSPLTHAEVLLARNHDDLDARKDARELCQSPPYRETLDPGVYERATKAKGMPVGDTAANTRLMSFPHSRKMDTWLLHHAAPFAAVRWTNVFDPAVLVFFGDVIGGPLARVFGPAIADIDLKARRGGRQSWTFTHTKYWALGDAVRIETCREAVNLLDEANPAESQRKRRARPPLADRTRGR
jgi:hypothetical protein